MRGGGTPRKPFSASAFPGGVSTVAASPRNCLLRESFSAAKNRLHGNRPQRMSGWSSIGRLACLHFDTEGWRCWRPVNLSRAIKILTASPFWTAFPCWRHSVCPPLLSPCVWPQPLLHWSWPILFPHARCFLVTWCVINWPGKKRKGKSFVETFVPGPQFSSEAHMNIIPQIRRGPSLLTIVSTMITVYFSIRHWHMPATTAGRM